MTGVTSYEVSIDCMNTPETETERLRLRKFTQDDIPALLEILQDGDVNRLIPSMVSSENHGGRM